MNSHSFFDSMRNTDFRRMPDGWLGGVATALSRKYGWDLTLVRGVMVVAAVFSLSTAVIIYLAAWLLLPEAGSNRIELEEVVSGRLDAKNLTLLIFSGLVVAYFTFGFAIFLPFMFGTNSQILGVVPLVLLVVVVVALLLRRSSASPSDFTPPYYPSADFPSVSAAAPQTSPTDFPTPPPSDFTYPQPSYPSVPQYPVSTPLPPAVPKRWGAGPGVPTFLALSGVMMLVLTGMMAVSVVYHGFFDRFFPVIFLGVAFVLSGLTLAFLALRGRRGTWLTVLTFLALFLVLPVVDTTLRLYVFR